MFLQGDKNVFFKLHEALCNTLLLGFLYTQTVMAFGGKFVPWSGPAAEIICLPVGVEKNLPDRQPFAEGRGTDKLKLKPCDERGLMGSGPRGSCNGFVFRVQGRLRSAGFECCRS